jgi:hypothetical protein
LVDLSFLGNILSKLPIKFEYKYHKIERVFIFESDRYNVCEPVKERRRILGILPVITHVHRKDNDEWDIKNLW